MWVEAIAISAAGAAAYAAGTRLLFALQAPWLPLSRWWWQVVYHPADDDYTFLWSIELVELRPAGNVIGRLTDHPSYIPVKATIYRIYGGNFDRRWRANGRIIDGKYVNLEYHSTHSRSGGHGIMRVSPLNQSVCCGHFNYTPSEEERARGSSLLERRGTLRIGADFSKTLKCEWIRADERADDPVRCFLATIPSHSAAHLPKLVAPAGVQPLIRKAYDSLRGRASNRATLEDLPMRARRLLTENPPYLPSWIAGAGAATVPASPLALAKLEEQLRADRGGEPVPHEWRSPTAEILGIQRRPRAAGE